MDKIKHKPDCRPAQRKTELIMPIVGMRCKNCGEEWRKREENPFCDNCKEPDCLCSTDDTCALIRIYLKVVADRERRIARRQLLESKGYKLTGNGRVIPPEPRYDEVYVEGVKQLDRS